MIISLNCIRSVICVADLLYIYLLLIYLFSFLSQSSGNGLTYYLVQTIRYIFSDCIRHSNFPFNTIVMS